MPICSRTFFVHAISRQTVWPCMGRAHSAHNLSNNNEIHVPELMLDPVCSILDYVVQSHVYKRPKMNRLIGLFAFVFVCVFSVISFNLIIRILIVMDTMLYKLNIRSVSVKRSANGCYHSPLLLSFKYKLEMVDFCRCCCFLGPKIFLLNLHKSERFPDNYPSDGRNFDK